MMFHRQPRLFVESELLGEDDVCKLETDPDAFIEKMLKRQSDVKSKAPGNIAKAQAKQKKDYDKRHFPEVSPTRPTHMHTHNAYIYMHACMILCCLQRLGIDTWNKSDG